jgi:hypothetical protein
VINFQENELWPPKILKLFLGVNIFNTLNKIKNKKQKRLADKSNVLMHLRSRYLGLGIPDRKKKA